MKRKRCLYALLALILAFTALSGCKANEQTEIYMFLGSPEFKEPTQALCDEYMKLNPGVKIVFETSSDYMSMFQAKINTGELPDIFFVPTGLELKNYEQFCYDLSDQPLASALTDSAKASLSYGDKLCGFAQACDLFGLIYNMDILSECGITKVPETNEEMTALCEAVSAKGYNVFTTGYKELWVWKHVLQPYLNMTGEPAYDTFSKIGSGEKTMADYSSLYNDFFNFVDLTLQYSGTKPLECGFDAEISEMAAGKTAVMVGQGSWAEGEILRTAPDFNLGFGGYPVSSNASDCKVVLGTSQAICVWKDSKVRQAALDFANWWNTSDYGKSWYADVIITYPPIKDAKFPTSNLNNDAMKSIDEKGAGRMSCYDIPVAFTDAALGQVMQVYAAGDITKDEACTQLQGKIGEFLDD